MVLGYLQIHKDMYLFSKYQKIGSIEGEYRKNNFFYDDHFKIKFLYFIRKPLKYSLKLVSTHKKSDVIYDIYVHLKIWTKILVTFIIGH